MKLLVHEIIDHQAGNKVIATIWVNEKGKVECDDNDFLSNLQHAEVDGYSIRYGVSFVERLPKLFRGSYLSARKVKK